MMPIGVEHLREFEEKGSHDRVRIPMMPKGVEHTADSLVQSAITAVRIPMMPKGVEHKIRTKRPPNLTR